MITQNQKYFLIIVIKMSNKSLNNAGLIFYFVTNFKSLKFIWAC